jgi:hypothetical protein
MKLKLEISGSDMQTIVRRHVEKYLVEQGMDLATTRIYIPWPDTFWTDEFMTIEIDRNNRESTEPLPF